MERLTVIISRLVQLLPVLLGISIVTFLLMQLAPGDPVRLLVGDRASAEVIAAVRQRYGLDQPIWMQYVTYVENLLQADLGRSLRFRVPVADLIVSHLPATLFLVAYAISLTVVPTVALAILSARGQDRWADQIVRILGVCGLTIPVFWLGIMLSRLFGVELGWFPVSGYGEGFAAHLHHLFLPALSTAIWLTPILVRNLRAALLEQIQADFVVASRSKGLPEGYIFRRHVLLNALLPTLHLFGVMIAYLIGGTVVVETVYAVPGLGRLMIGSIIGRDYYVVQGLTLLFALSTVLVTLVIDILSTIIDPRVRL